MTHRLIALAALAGLTAATSASAALILQINPTTKTFAFTGSDTATAEDFGEYYDIGWTVYNVGNPAGNDYGFTEFDSNLISISGASYYGAYTEIVSNWGVGGNASIDLAVDSSGPVSILGTGVTGSYAGWAAGAQQRFELLDGATMTQTSGSGASPVTVTVVPEPSTYAALAGLAGFGVVFVRRRRASI